MKKIITILLLLLVFPTIALAQTYEKSAKLKITDEEVNINDYFNLGSKQLSWSISDPSAATILSNTIMPIKAGKIDITAINNGDKYILHLEITENESTTVTNDKDINQVMQDVKTTNPSTGDGIILLVMVIALSLLTIIFFNYKMQHARFEGE